MNILPSILDIKEAEIEALDLRLVKLNKQLEVANNVIAYYADEYNYECGGFADEYSRVQHEDGVKAREYLKEFENE